MQYTKNLEVRYHADVMVIGGGPAGVTAAVAAARHGKKVLLVEATGALGCEIVNEFGPNRYGTCALPIRMESMRGKLIITKL